MNKSILLCGVGGQGTVLASKVIANAAMSKGLSVKSAETIGMAQKGGSVFSHLKIGDAACSPMVGLGTADVIIGFEPAETVRMLPYLKPDGLVVVCENPVMPVTEALKASTYTGTEMMEYLKANVRNLISVDGRAACEQIGSPKVLNMVLLGAAVKSGCLGLSISDIEETVQRLVKPEFLELNFKAIAYSKV